jgi:hypothetical protein
MPTAREHVPRASLAAESGAERDAVTGNSPVKGQGGRTVVRAGTVGARRIDAEFRRPRLPDGQSPSLVPRPDCGICQPVSHPAG